MPFGIRGLNLFNMSNKLKVEIWSDIMCPFCYIGKRHFEAALDKFNNKENIEIEWKSFQLDPSIPELTGEPKSVYQYLAERKGISYEQSERLHQNVVAMAKAVGLEYNFDKAIVANSFNAHRMIQLSKTKGLGDKAEERLFLAYFTQGKNFGDPQTLIELGKDIGLTEHEVKEALTNDEYAFKVKQDIQEAANIGINGVPFFVFNRRYGISGAQPVEVFTETFEKAFEEWKKDHPEIKLSTSSGPVCDPEEGCSI